MIRREDMLELTRRMNLSRTSIDRIAGCYVDEEGFIDGTFNTHFLKLSAAERTSKIEVAKKIPFSSTNEELVAYRFSEKEHGPDSMRQLLLMLRDCGLKNDALADTFYDIMVEKLPVGSPYGIFLFHDVYDIPVKGKDKERQWESEEIYNYLICAICPVDREYEPDSPVAGFLFPSFSDRSSDLDHIAVFSAGDFGMGLKDILEI